jgi:hypothetical protein
MFQLAFCSKSLKSSRSRSSLSSLGRLDCAAGPPWQQGRGGRGMGAGGWAGERLTAGVACGGAGPGPQPSWRRSKQRPPRPPHHAGCPTTAPPLLLTLRCVLMGTALTSRARISRESVICSASRVLRLASSTRRLCMAM